MFFEYFMQIPQQFSAAGAADYLSACSAIGKETAYSIIALGAARIMRHNVSDAGDDFWGHATIEVGYMVFASAQALKAIGLICTALV